MTNQLPPIPKSDWYKNVEGLIQVAYTKQQLTAYGQACYSDGYQQARADMHDHVEPMIDVADRFAHRMAMHLELFMSDYGGKYYTDALNTLSEYRSAMNAIHEQHSPTHMGEPLLPLALVLFTPKHLAGVFAMNAVRQSPYLVPDNLAEAIVEFMAGFDCTQPVLEWKYPLDCSQAVKDAIMNSPLCLKWNERKNGRDGMGFTSRYDQPHPDDDFIDLDALQMNICRAIFEDQSHDV